MSEQNKSNGESSQLPGLAIVALLLGLFVFQDTIFNPSRPVMTGAEKTSTEDVRSRLWQDPFEAAALHEQNYHAQDSHSEKIIVIGDNGSKIVEIQQPKNTPVASKTQLDFAYQMDLVPQRICHSADSDKEAGAHTIGELRCQIQKKQDEIIKKEQWPYDDNKKPDILVLAIMVPGGPYAEDQEWRLRSRYAVISGMATAGFTPADSEHIGFVDFKQKCITEIEVSNKSESNSEKSVRFCGWPPYMPYEWFESNDSKFKDAFFSGSNAAKVLVLWLNNTVFADNNNPMEMLGELKGVIEKGIIDPNEGKKSDNAVIADNDNPMAILGKLKFNFNIIGPHDSPTLQKMYEEVLRPETKHSKLNIENLSNSLLFSSSATIDTAELKRKARIKVEGKRVAQSDYILFNKKRQWFEKKVVNTVSDHKILANTLLCELALRGVTPYRVTEESEVLTKKECGIPGLVLNQNKEPRHMVLIGEWDTFYSRNLTDSILFTIEEHSGIPYSKDHIHIFNYLRGLDGANADQATNNNKRHEKKGAYASDSHKDETKAKVRAPVGTNQFDYLRRLESQIQRLHKEKIKQGGIKAIGILGSDVYDKLLILQALRHKFPGVLFFTTDLDALLLPPNEKELTRNLIVASPFGLTLHEDLQKSILPFRDAYQTSLYLSTLFATHCWREKGQGQCSSKALKDIFTDDEKLRRNPRLFEIGRDGAVDLSHTSGELVHPDPAGFKNPQLFLYGLLFVIFITAFLYYVIPQNYRKYILVVGGVFGCVFFLYLFLQKFDDFVAETFSFTNGTSTWPANAIRLSAFVLAAFFLYDIWEKLRKNNAKIKEYYIEPSIQKGLADKKDCEDRKANNSFWSLLCIDWWRKSDESKESIYFIDLWSEYHKYRGWACCCLRIVVMLFLYGLCVLTLIEIGLINEPHIPFRGETNLKAINIILGAAAFLYLILIFIIADVAHSSSHFIKLLTRPEVTWPKGVLETYAAKYDLPENSYKNKILMDFICQHTEAINKFVFYPFIILLLMIVSRSSLFDNWQIPPVLLGIFIFTALIALSSAIRLRQAAQYARDCVVERLGDNYSQSLLNKKLGNSSEIKLLLNEIRDLKTGPFLPLKQNPIIWSLLIPFSGAGGLYLIEYFAFIA